MGHVQPSKVPGVPYEYCNRLPYGCCCIGKRFKVCQRCDHPTYGCTCAGKPHDDDKRQGGRGRR